MRATPPPCPPQPHLGSGPTRGCSSPGVGDGQDLVPHSPGWGGASLRRTPRAPALPLRAEAQQEVGSAGPQLRAGRHPWRAEPVPAPVAPTGVRFAAATSVFPESSPPTLPRQPTASAACAHLALGPSGLAPLLPESTRSLWYNRQPAGECFLILPSRPRGGGRKALSKGSGVHLTVWPRALCLPASPHPHLLQASVKCLPDLPPLPGWPQSQEG